MQTWLNLQDKIIIVTGGASGIGLAIVEELLAQGANVQMVDIHGGDGQYEGHKGYQFWPTDISSAKEVNHTVAEIIQRFGRIDGLSITPGSISRVCWSMRKRLPGSMNSTKLHSKKWSISTRKAFF
ncbi:sorbitol-6-phosphate 2-dehydrogenase [Escherichia coli]|uniref:Sorbitol-6-phosphate 2-dehydrogenase n=1 Tax=Escherichia coli TaxID=562 RepID=A0A377B706_ECOLX|nr:sorbitol-6-phosphate 2-dehydrogenase [Escherichia coli]